MTDNKINIAELAHIGRTGKICEDACRIQNAESGCYCAMVADALLAQAAEISRLAAERDAAQLDAEAWARKCAVADKMLDAALPEVQALIAAAYEAAERNLRAYCVSQVFKETLTEQLCSAIGTPDDAIRALIPPADLATKIGDEE